MTKHAEPLAQEVGSQQIDRARLNEVFEKLKTLREETNLNGLSWKELRDAGRP